MARGLRVLAGVRGWERIVSWLVPADASGDFVVANATGLFKGNLSSFIDRRMYLYGGYELDNIQQFLSRLPPERLGTILDVGANVGTHSLAFARHFEHVHAFEPNPDLWRSFETNIRINNISNVHLHKVGLADKDATLPFFAIEKNNYGLGTFSTADQYDLPLKEIGMLRVVAGDSYIVTSHIRRVDAIKIDVQGFEFEVIRGLARVLKRDRPFVWMEVGTDTAEKATTPKALQDWFPYRTEVYRFEELRRTLRSRVRLVPAADDQLQACDYLISPAP